MPLLKPSVLLVLALASCNLYSNRDSARAVADALRDAAVARETQTIELARRLIEGRLTEVRARLRAEFERSLAEARLKVHDRIDAKRLQLSTMVKTDVATALDPVLSQLNTELQKAKQVQGEGAPRLREYALAAQQAATMAVASHEVFAILEDVDKKLRDLRTEIDQQFTGLAGQADLVPALDGQVETLLAQLKQQSAEYQSEIDGAQQQLRRYFDTADAPGLFFSGLGKGVGWNLDSLGDKADQLLEKGRNAIARWVGEKTSQLESSLASRADGFLADAANRVSKQK